MAEVYYDMAEACSRYYSSRSEDEVKQVVANLEQRGIQQWHTYRIAEHLPELSKDRMG